MKFLIFFFFIIIICVIPLTVDAVEVSSKIIDREIIESLAVLKQGQINVNQRFDDINRRIDGIQNTMLVFFTIIIMLIVALFGYIIWDRRTAMQPLLERIENLEIEFQKHMKLQYD